ncbi:TNF receptor-associated factor 4-like isoform X1 [Stylophora pistillata]|uniref:TNF receptor-associated factor 4-like isoform X1 n=1 Tax=Stylophora pistillata TaxID=50429 RepID=UPI000C053996|nr:TNF receptor-associated factor 4-like isoform X1 [Stylophora pistillata]
MEAVYEDFQCPICHLPLKEPVQTRCGHRYCKGCLDEDIRRKRSQGRSLTCPSDRQNLDPDKDIFPDKATERKILSLAIRCPNDSCGWTGELRNKEVHLRSCPVHQVLCSNKNCGVIVIRRLLKQHETLRCVWRILQCTHCSESHPACKMPEHFKQCNKFPVTCPNNCGRSVSRDMVSTHTEDECPRTILSCPFARVGCKQKVQRQEMESHLESTTRVHLDFTYSCNNNTEDELKDTIAKLSETKAELSETKAELRKTKAELIETKAELSKTKAELIETKVKTKLELSETKAELKEAVKQLKLLSVKHTNSFLWRIDGFSEIFKLAQTDKDKNDIYSDPFYTKTETESYGYKLKVNVCPNGHGVGEKTHLSVYIFIMKGEYDAILPWPFTKKVKFTLIDQQEDPDQRQNKTHEIVGQYSKHWARPMTDGNVGTGGPKFISHEELNSGRFFVDDVLFLQVDIE